MSRNIWSDPSRFVTAPKQAATVLRDMEMPRIDRYLDAVAERGEIDLDALRKLSANTLLAMDDPDHLRLRRLIAPFFSRSGLSRWQPVIEDACDRACDVLADARHPDLVRDFTAPLFMKVMPKILGVAVTAEDDFFAAVETAQRLTEPYLPVATLKALNAAIAYLLATCRTRNDADGISLLDQLRSQQKALPPGQSPEHVVVGLLAGSNSATQSLAFALHGLLSDRVAIWQRAGSADWTVADSHALLGRYQSTRTLVRTAPQGAGCPHHAGQGVVVDVVAVNDRMRAESGTGAAHLSFGSGPHKCPGLFLSELLFQIALPKLARRFPHLTLKQDACQFVVTPMMQAPIALPCLVQARSQRASARLVAISDRASARHILKDDDGFAAPPMAAHLAALSEASGRDFAPAMQIARNALFFLDGARHSALKEPLQSTLGHQQLAPWTDMVDATITELLDGLRQQPQVDLVREFSDPLRQRVMMRILGIETRDDARFHALAPRFQDVLKPWLSLQALETVQQAFAEALSLMSLPSTPGTPVSVLEALRTDPPAASDTDDLKAAVLVLYGASFNTSHTLSNAAHWLLCCPEKIRRRAARDGGIEDMLEDVIARACAPKYIYRQAQHDMALGGLDIRAGDTARLDLRILNRRAAGGPGHMAFGQGQHRCIGSALSRLILSRALPELLRRLPDLRLCAQQHRYLNMSQTSALASLPCTQPIGPHHDD